ncbi:xyloglucan endotransglucosylase/hydrolase protein 2 [Capsicum annuum]|uniref:xyloglucan endotransglucosylase/hydrolase protein 2 n=2 Tax=Capsicum annuum TaxID=4072 RepID=UPI0007BF2CC1|nr:xyloglucan endotransglucosylase/hydrolase protein 2 [Capsicum annuum]
MYYSSIYIKVMYLFGFLLLRVFSKGDQNVPYDVHYNIIYGNQHVVSFNQGRELQISMDNSSGSGFGSKMNYGSGYFHMKIKLPNRDSAGVVVAFYLHSNTNLHDEIDFEFLGNREGQPYNLQTNVFANGEGGREQRIHLWFDPTADFHNYKILWNNHQIVFFVDKIPIRIFKNNSNIGVGYPQQPMQLLATIWDGDDWATNGGYTKINWSFAPFKANFKDFKIGGCPIINSNDNHNCNSQDYWWNKRKYWELSFKQRRLYKEYRAKYITYDYCDDIPRYSIPPQECSINMIKKKM